MRRGQDHAVAEAHGMAGIFPGSSAQYHHNLSHPACAGLDRGKEDLLLGSWQGVPVRSSAKAVARLRILMQAVDDVFDRADATLARTSYRSRWSCSRCTTAARLLSDRFGRIPRMFMAAFRTYVPKSHCGESSCDLHGEMSYPGSPLHGLSVHDVDFQNFYISSYKIRLLVLRRA